MGCRKRSEDGVKIVKGIQRNFLKEGDSLLAESYMSCDAYVAIFLDI